MGMFVVGMGEGQWQQGEGKQQGAHGGLRRVHVLLRYNKLSAAAKMSASIGAGAEAWEHAWIVGGERKCEFAE
ncbi:hypothetical protein D3C81_2267880 [compost metagenome]